MNDTKTENRLKEDLDYILDNTKPLWDELRGRRIFVTGGTGFFGCWLLESFLWANEKLDLNSSVTVLTRNPRAFQRKAPHLYANPAIRFHEGDIRDFDFPQGDFSHVIHAAGEVGAIRTWHSSLSLFDGIVQGTRRALEFVRYCNAKKILFTSSGAVYGKQPSDMLCISEDYNGAPEPTDFASGYGEGKRAAEFLVSSHAEHDGFQAEIARCFAFVGPYLPLDSHLAIGNFIGNILRKEPVCVKGDGTPYRSYLYAADLAIWLWTILFRGESTRPYNVGSEEEYAIADIARTVADFLQDTEVHISEKAVPGRSAQRYIPSTQRARHELGLKQNVPLQEAVRRTIAWYSMRACDNNCHSDKKSQ